jgi:hypothetical protein
MRNLWDELRLVVLIYFYCLDFLFPWTTAGQQHGPYDTNQMKMWFAAGFFPPITLVRRAIETAPYPIFSKSCEFTDTTGVYIPQPTLVEPLPDVQSVVEEAIGNITPAPPVEGEQNTSSDNVDEEEVSKASSTPIDVFSAYLYIHALYTCIVLIPGWKAMVLS